MMVLRLAGLLLLAAVLILWIYSVAEYDGDCGCKCDECLFPDGCPVKKMKEAHGGSDGCVAEEEQPGE